MPIQENCRIIDHQQVSPRHFKLLLDSHYISSQALPGQFVNVKCSPNLDPLLRRPLGLHRIGKGQHSLELLYEVVGKGTTALTSFFVGEQLNLLGPLGQGFDLNIKKRNHLLVGGGVGIVPLLFLAEHLKSESNTPINVFIGAKNRELVLGEKDFREIADQVLVATDDGSYGEKGLVSDLLNGFIDNQLTASQKDTTIIYACGPQAMLRAIADLAFQEKIDCQISLDARLACGIGACKGCAVKTTTGYKMVCKDGPVFDAKEIIFNDK